MTRLLLIRHGETPSNLQGLLDTAVPGPGLTEDGHAQAEALPRSLSGVPVRAVFASTALRAQLTAEPLARSAGVPVLVRDGLREIQAGALEMRGDADAVRQYIGALFAWIAGDLDVRMPQAESGREVLERMDAVVAEAAALAGPGTTVLVSHGGLIRFWSVVRSRNVQPEFAAVHGLGNTAVVVLDGGPACGWRMQSWDGLTVGDSDHVAEGVGDHDENHVGDRDEDDGGARAAAPVEPETA